MNSFIKYIPESLNDHKAFVELLLSIIDTKLQFIKYRTDVIITDYSEFTISNEPPGNSHPFLDNHPDIEGVELMIGTIEKYSKTTKLLLLLRSKLSVHNVSLIYDLLNNNRYLTYDHKSLDQLLEENFF